MENIEQMLIEAMADFLDDPEIAMQEILGCFGDPEPPEETELHIRMAKAAMKEYKKTVKSKGLQI